MLHLQLPVYCMKNGLRTDIPSFDLNAACAGYVYGLKVAASLLQNSKERYALVIGSEQISTRLDMEDRNTCVLLAMEQELPL